jgi:putative transposase
MVRYRRNFLDGGTYFFTATLVDRRSDVLVRHIEGLRTAFRLTRQAHPFAIDAIVVLPDHLHVVMTLPAGDAGFPVPRRRNGELALWQRRFWEHTIRDDRDFAAHVDYIHYNPVKHGLVARVRDWPHSSFHRYVRRGLCPPDWAGDARGGKGEFGEP